MAVLPHRGKKLDEPRLIYMGVVGIFRAGIRCSLDFRQFTQSNYAGYMWSFTCLVAMNPYGLNTPLQSFSFF